MLFRISLICGLAAALPAGAKKSVLLDTTDRVLNWNALHEDLATKLLEHEYSEHDSIALARKFVSDLQDKVEDDSAEEHMVASAQASTTCKAAHSDFITKQGEFATALEAVKTAKEKVVEAKAPFKCECNLDHNYCPSPPPAPPSSPPPPVPGILFGDKVIQIDTFRIGALDDNHLCIGHRDGQTVQIFRSDGTLHPGPRTDWNPWMKEDNQGVYEIQPGSMAGIEFGDNVIQIGTFRIGALDDNHLCIGHQDGQTVQIFRSDGTLHPGPRTDWNPWSQPLGEPAGVEFKTNLIQIGKFRIGALDSSHLSVGHSDGQTEAIYRSDGEVIPGPRTDYNPWSM